MLFGFGIFFVYLRETTHTIDRKKVILFLCAALLALSGCGWAATRDNKDLLVDIDYSLKPLD